MFLVYESAVIEVYVICCLSKTDIPVPVHIYYLRYIYVVVRTKF